MFSRLARRRHRTPDSAGPHRRLRGQEHLRSTRDAQLIHPVERRSLDISTQGGLNHLLRNALLKSRQATGARPSHGDRVKREAGASRLTRSRSSRRCPRNGRRGASGNAATGWVSPGKAPQASGCSLNRRASGTREPGYRPDAFELALRRAMRVLWPAAFCTAIGFRGHLCSCQRSLGLISHGTCKGKDARRLGCTDMQ